MAREWRHFFSQPEPCCWFKGKCFCHLHSAHLPPLLHSSRQNRLGSLLALMTFPWVLLKFLACVRAHLPCWMGYSLSCSSLPCLSGVGISLLPLSPPHCLHLSSAFWAAPHFISPGKASSCLLPARPLLSLLSEASPFTSPDLERHYQERGFFFPLLQYVGAFH